VEDRVVRAGYESGPPCTVCGLYAINVVHDDEDTRRRNIETWAAPAVSMDGQDYYTWARVEYHPFFPVSVPASRRAVTANCRDAYERGYQAGYHASARKYGAL
jgi:hypothetical protein